MAKKKADNTELLKDLVIEGILDKKGQEVISLDLREVHDTVADYFIIAHGDSSTQVNAIFQSVLETTKAGGHLPYHSEGMKNGEWVIVDFVDVVAHIFYRERRDFYQLEELWSDAKVTRHDPEAAIKPKAVRQPIRKWVVSEDTLEDIEKSLPPSERTPVQKPFVGRPFAQRAAERKAAQGKVPAKGATPARKGPAKKKFGSKSPAPAKAAAATEKGSTFKKAVSSKSPAKKSSPSKAPASKKSAVTKKTSTKKK